MLKLCYVGQWELNMNKVNGLVYDQEAWKEFKIKGLRWTRKPM